MRPSVLLAKKTAAAVRNWLVGTLCHLPLNDRLDRPVFLTGCARSGTTILGRALAQHPSISYLNERRYYWLTCFPQLDSWSVRAPRRNGTIHLTEAACHPHTNKRLRRFFRLATRYDGGSRLVEKWPENNFRLGFVREIFPDALFLHIVRNGVEVARSIERWGLSYYGVNDYKWTALIRYAESVERYRPLPQLCQDVFDRGLLEWRMSVETALDFYESRSDVPSRRIRYEELLENPVETLQGIERFIEVEPSDQVHEFVRAKIARKSPTASAAELSNHQLEIAGPLLARLGYAPA